MTKALSVLLLLLLFSAGYAEGRSISPPPALVSTLDCKDQNQSKVAFDNPVVITIDNNGNLYIIDFNSILKITPDGVVTTLAGKAGKSGDKDGIGAKARFNNPWGITIDKEDNLYVTDTRNFLIRKIAPDGTVSIVAGKPLKTGSIDGTDARFGFPLDITTNNHGNLYVADTNNYLIRKIVLP